ncbi:MAG: hypothetical protein Q9162_003517 [Coniocarpon cinnabarinum]
MVGPTILDQDFGCLVTKDNTLLKAYLEALEPTNRRLIFLGLHFYLPESLLSRLPLRMNKILDRSEKVFRGFCQEYVRRRRLATIPRSPESAQARSSNVLSQMIFNTGLDDRAIVDQMLTFLAAGVSLFRGVHLANRSSCIFWHLLTPFKHDTTAAAMTWACYCLARAPEIQDILRHEVGTALSSRPAPPASATFESLPYLNGVCEEVLRLYPSIPINIREAVRDTTVAGVSTPKGTRVLLCAYALNRAADAWGPKANEFHPERWIDTASDGTRRPNKHGGAPSSMNNLTFSHGPRACIGRQLAKAELRTAIAGLVRKFRIELRYPERQALQAGVVTPKPAGGMHLKLTIVNPRVT